MTTTPIVVPQSPMGLGDVFGTAFSIMRRRFGRLVGITLVQLLVQALLLAPLVVFGVLVMLPQVDFASGTISSGYFTSAAIGMAIGSVLGLISTVVSVYFLGLLVQVAHQAMLNQDPDLAELRRLNRGTLRRLGPVYAVAMIAYYAVLVLGLLPTFAVFPELIASAGPGTTSTMSDSLALKFFGAWGVAMVTVLVVSVASGIVLVKAAYINQVGTVEGLGMKAAVVRAFGLTKGSFWRTAGYLIVMGIAVGVLQQAVGMIAEVVVFASSPNIFASGPQEMFSSGFLWIFYGVVYALELIIQVVCIPFQQAFVTVMYVDQVRRIQLGPVPRGPRPVPGHYGTYGPYPYPQAPFSQQPPMWPQPPAAGQPGYPPQGAPYSAQPAPQFLPQQPPRFPAHEPSDDRPVS
jgi:hypothetical protein